MEAIIGKELLSEVLGINDINLVLDEGNEINYTRYANMTRGSRDVFINKYELAHKCKEWAYRKGFKILDECNAIIITDLMDKEIHIIDDNFKSPYDIKRLFKAYQWIFDNRQ